MEADSLAMEIRVSQAQARPVVWERAGAVREVWTGEQTKSQRDFKARINIILCSGRKNF